MTDTEKTVTSTRKRGTGFPVLSLPAATKIIREAGTYGKMHTANALASYGGHTTANSGAWHAKAAALRDWGLVVTASADSFALTDRAMQIAHPTSPDAAQRAVLDAFRQCKLYAEIFKDMAKGTDLKISQIANTAVTTHGVAITSKDVFANSFVESAAAVGLAERVSADVVRLLAEPVATSEEANDNTDDESGARAPETGKSSGKPPRTAPPVVSQTWPLANGEIALMITSTKPFEAAVFVEIGTVISSIAKLAALAGLPNEEEKG